MVCRDPGLRVGYSLTVFPRLRRALPPEQDPSVNPCMMIDEAVSQRLDGRSHRKMHLQGKRSSGSRTTGRLR